MYLGDENATILPFSNVRLFKIIRLFCLLFCQNFWILFVPRFEFEFDFAFSKSVNQFVTSKIIEFSD